jgi:hypothetical protein
MSDGEREPLVIHRLIYVSRAKPEFTTDMEKSMRDLLAVAIARNYEIQVTGALLACDGWFLQALEGSRENVWSVYGRIGNDRRHGAIKLIEAKRVAGRTFGQWSMCGRCMSPLDDSIISALETKKGFRAADLTAPAALRLLDTICKLQLREEHV